METATSPGRERPVVDAEAALRFLAEASSVLGGFPVAVAKVV